MCWDWFESRLVLNENDWEVLFYWTSLRYHYSNMSTKEFKLADRLNIYIDSSSIFLNDYYGKTYYESNNSNNAAYILSALNFNRMPGNPNIETSHTYNSIVDVDIDSFITGYKNGYMDGEECRDIWDRWDGEGMPVATPLEETYGNIRSSEEGTIICLKTKHNSIIYVHFVDRYIILIEGANVTIFE